MSTRREIRARVLQALYAQELSGDDAEHIVETLLRPKFEAEALRFAEKLLLRALDAADEANQRIAAHAQNWELGRIAVTDRMILRMAITEFLYFADIPPKVTINEAIELAKRYSTPQSGTFVNGILDAALAEFRAEGRLKKSGRGLVDVSPTGR